MVSDMAKYVDLIRYLEEGCSIHRKAWQPGIQVYVDHQYLMCRIGTGDPDKDYLYAPMDQDKNATDWEVCKFTDTLRDTG